MVLFMLHYIIYYTLYIVHYILYIIYYILHCILSHYVLHVTLLDVFSIGRGLSQRLGDDKVHRNNPLSSAPPRHNHPPKGLLLLPHCHATPLYGVTDHLTAFYATEWLVVCSLCTSTSFLHKRRQLLNYIALLIRASTIIDETTAFLEFYCYMLYILYADLVTEYCKHRSFSNLTIIAIIATSDLTVIPIIATSDL